MKENEIKCPYCFETIKKSDVQCEFCDSELPPLNNLKANVIHESKLDATQKYCTFCGEVIKKEAVRCRYCHASLGAHQAKSNFVPKSMTFFESIETCCIKYFVFEGRAGKSEFWWFFLFVNAGLIFFEVLTPLLWVGAEFYYWLFYILILIPFLAVSARRLHDTGRSGWLQLLALTIIGCIPLIIWLTQDGNERGDRYNI